jgi:ribose/xylose/arabinose/galactoside ABC-type transport system permease subunit
MNLRKRALGLSLGVVWGLAVFVVTILATMRGRGDTLLLLRGYYPGFTVSYLGSLVGLVWGFVNGFVGGVLIAWFYDLFSKILYKSEPATK